MKKTMWVILTTLSLALILGNLPLTSQAAPLYKFSWRTEYYDNDSLSGQPVNIRFEDAVSHDWGRGSPGPNISSNNFSARWSVTRQFDKGTYLFFLTVDDGARVWLDGELIIDAWSLGRKSQIKKKVYFDKSGDHKLQVAYFEKRGNAEIDFRWITLGQGDVMIGAWAGEYFSNRNLEGSPDVVRDDGAINFDWNSGAPDYRITRDNFSVRWKRTIYLSEDDYTFRIQHDDGMRVYIDGERIYDSWQDQGVSYRTRTVELDEGMHDFTIEYYDHTGNAVAVFLLDGDPGQYNDIDDDGTTDDDDDDDGDSSRKTIVIDNKSSAFHWGGPSRNRNASNGGYGTGFFWTYNTNSNSVNFGKWKPRNLRSGDYEVFVYIPDSHSTTDRASYRVWHDGDYNDRRVDQSDYNDQWVSLGTYHFSGNDKEGVILHDSTRETTGSRQIAFDAVRFVPR